MNLLLIGILLISIASSALADDAATVWEQILGKTLYKWNGTGNEKEVVELPTVDALRGKKVVGLYFSASWCGPCKQFTPQLAKFYEDMNKKGKKFEIVWISGDRGVDEFIDYYSQMPWAALTVENVNALGQTLNEKYKVKGIPHLVILDGDDATVYTLDGRTKVLSDKYGLEFPYAPRSPLMFLPKPLKRLFSNQLEKMQTKMKEIMGGLIESIAPKKIFSKIAAKAQQVVKSAVSKVIDILKQKIQALVAKKNKI